MSESLSLSGNDVFDSLEHGTLTSADRTITHYGSMTTLKKASLLRECLEKKTMSCGGSRESLKSESNALQRKVTSYQNEIMCTVLCCSGNLAHGFAYGLASPAVPELLARGTLTEHQASWFESLLILGGLVGGLLVGFLIGSLGRRGTILLSGVPFIAGWILIAISNGYMMLYAGRMLTGVGYGIVQVACPMYIAETVSKEVRGSLSLAVVLASTSGILAQYSLGLVLNMQWLAIVSLIPVILMLIGMGLMPESPRWLIATGRSEQAFDNLVWLRKSTKEDTLMEYNEMVLSVESVTGFMDKCNIESLKFLPMAAKPLAVSMFLFVFQQLSGITPVMFNAQTIFKRMEHSSTSSFVSNDKLSAIVLGIFKMASTVLGLVLIDRVGRRPLFIVCGLIMSACCLVVGIYMYYTSQMVVNMPWLPMSALILYVSAYSVAWGGIPWVVLSEIVPLRYRGLATALGSIGTWVTAFVITQEFFSLVHIVLWWGIFLIFAAVCLLGTTFAYFFMPETKLRSLESIESDLSISFHT